MTTIILISLGVVLAAAAALMTISYAGDAMQTGEVKAQAATLENAAQNIQAAMTGRRFSGVRQMPTRLEELHSSEGNSRWMSSLPDVRVSGGSTPQLRDDRGTRLYVVPDISEKVCRYVNRDYLERGTPVPGHRGIHPRGCFVDDDGSFTFYSVMGSVA